MKKESCLQIELNFDRLILSVVIFCLASEALIVFLDIFYNLAQFWYFEKFQRMSNVDAEKSFGTWFSVVQNFIVAIAALIISLHYKFISRIKGQFIGWLIIALFFAYISLDEHLMLHENIGSAAPVFFHWFFGKKITLPTYGWHFVFWPIFGSFGFFSLIFLYKELKNKNSRVILIVSLVLWGMAVILDAWDGTRNPYDWLVEMTGFKEFTIRHSFMLIEELFEMLGSTLFLYLFLSHIRALYTRQETFIKPSR